MIVSVTYINSVFHIQVSTIITYTTITYIISLL